MKTTTVTYGNQQFPCRKYDIEDEPQILDTFFFWKTTVLLAEQTKSRRPQLPETFSEPFCCLVCGLLHKPGSGLDAFRYDEEGQVRAVEIKATITPTGFTDVKLTEAGFTEIEITESGVNEVPINGFDELYWLSFADYNAYRYEVYRLEYAQITELADKSKTLRDRKTINLKSVVDQFDLPPVARGRIGVLRALPATLPLEAEPWTAEDVAADLAWATGR